jgi:hypothetical protein
MRSTGSSVVQVRSLFIPVVCAGLLLSGLVHLLFPDETEKHMSSARNVRIVGAFLLVLMVPAVVFGYYILGVLFALFGVPRLLMPHRSIRLQQSVYPRRVHGALLLTSAAGLWIVSRLLRN